MGTPDECADVVERARQALGLTGVDCTFYFGGIDYPKARASLELFAREVMPEFKEQEEKRQRHKMDELAPYVAEAMKRKERMRELADNEIPAYQAYGFNVAENVDLSQLPEANRRRAEAMDALL